MKLLRYLDRAHGPRLGLLHESGVLDLTARAPKTCGSIRALLSLERPRETLESLLAALPPRPVCAWEELGAADSRFQWLPPMDEQEVWAAGVTYIRSKVARMEESRKAGGGSFYDKVYQADRPELFFKATARRVVGPGAAVRIRADSKWNVPEPEIALLIGPKRNLVGFTLGNDMSSRDIEGENPLYLPQAKVYRGSCALGPTVRLAETVTDWKRLEISMDIRRDGKTVFEGKTSLAQMKRTPQELADWLFREDDFAAGVVLLTGTGIIPPDSFSLEEGDRIRISSPEIGVLENVVAR